MSVSENITQLQDKDFVCSLAFLTDMTAHLKVLNLSLQGKQQNISHLVVYIEAFCKKLQLFRASLRTNELAHFTYFSELTADNIVSDFSHFVSKIEVLSTEFEKRFRDLKN